MHRALRVLIVLAAVSLAACATGPAPDSARELDVVAEAYVKATLAIGVREDGYVDAYHGPQEWADEAAATDADLAAIAVELDAIRAGQHENRQILARLELHKCGLQIASRSRINGVANLWPVEGDYAHRTVVVDMHRHGNPPFCCMNRPPPRGSSEQHAY